MIAGQNDAEGQYGTNKVPLAWCLIACLITAGISLIGGHNQLQSNCQLCVNASVASAPEQESFVLYLKHCELLALAKRSMVYGPQRALNCKNCSRTKDQSSLSAHLEYLSAKEFSALGIHCKWIVQCICRHVAAICLAMLCSCLFLLPTRAMLTAAWLSVNHFIALLVVLGTNARNVREIAVSSLYVLLFLLSPGFHNSLTGYSCLVAS